VQAVNDIFDMAFDPTTAAWDLDSDGIWHRRVAADGDGEALVDLQSRLIFNISHRGGTVA
jgi:polyphosphate kinase